MKVEALVDAFVAALLREPREPKESDEVPPSLRLSNDDSGLHDWTIRQSSRITWIDDLKSTLPASLPRSFLSLVTRYEYPPLQLGAMLLFANTAEGVEYEWRDRIVADRAISDFLTENRLIHFAMPSDGQYDPVCFDARTGAHRNEYRIVRVDHEAILCKSKLRIEEEIAPSFLEVVSERVKRGG